MQQRRRCAGKTRGQAPCGSFGDHGIKSLPRETHPLRNWLKDLHGVVVLLRDSPFNLESDSGRYRRFFFFERGTRKLWYLAPGAYAGPAVLIPMDGLFKNGGEIVAIASMTADGGRNASDRLVVLSSILPPS